jgi:hypothetical protein
MRTIGRRDTAGFRRTVRIGIAVAAASLTAGVGVAAAGAQSASAPATPQDGITYLASCGSITVMSAKGDCALRAQRLLDADWHSLAASLQPITPSTSLSGLSELAAAQAQATVIVLNTLGPSAETGPLDTVESGSAPGGGSGATSASGGVTPDTNIATCEHGIGYALSPISIGAYTRDCTYDGAPQNFETDVIDDTLYRKSGSFYQDGYEITTCYNADNCPIRTYVRDGSTVGTFYGHSNDGWDVGGINGGNSVQTPNFTVG